MTAAEIDKLKCGLIAEAFHTRMPADVEAADQLIRTRIHPDLYDTIQRLNGLFHDGGEASVRRVAEYIGYTSVLQLFPHAREIVETYRDRVDVSYVERQMLAQSYKELLLLAAIFSEELLAQISLALYSVSVHASLQSYYDTITQQQMTLPLFYREMHEAVKQLQPYDPLQQNTVYSDLPPIVVAVLNADGNTQQYTLTPWLHIDNLFSPTIAVRFDGIQQRTQQAVTKTVSIPLSAIVDGILFECHIPHAYTVDPVIQRYFLSREELSGLVHRGSAIPHVLGPAGDIRIYPEYIHPRADLSTMEAPIFAHFRITSHSIELSKLPGSHRLTVFI